MWYGITCDYDYDSTPLVLKVVYIELSENNLVGSIPDVTRLTSLKGLRIFGNHLTGILPSKLIERNLTGVLDFRADNAQLTDLLKIDFESNPSALLCGSQRIIFTSDGKETLFTTRCRSATITDRRTFCEVKEGQIYSGFAVLAWFIEKNGFFDLKPEYSLSVTDATFLSTRVIRNGKTYEVVEYAGGGPFELWTIQNAIGGMAFSTNWTKTTRIAKCPRWGEANSP